MILYIDHLCKVYQESEWGFSHENDSKYSRCNDTGAVYILHILLVCAVRDIRFGHAVCLCCALSRAFWRCMWCTDTDAGCGRE
jgi:hypothetical protein